MKAWFTLILAALASGVVALDGYTVPPGSPGYQHGNSTQAIQFDKHSLYIDGKRIFVYSGEFHPWRLPSPSLWSDILQKMKAAGFNAVSIYTHWGLVEQKKGSVDWSYYRSIELFYEVAKRVGIYVISRPGPYINAETTGGGLPAWLTNSGAVARTADNEYVDAFQTYLHEFAQTTSRYQYPAGPVIAVQAENEFYVSGKQNNPTATEQMIAVEKVLREGGINKVPITHNDVWPSGNFASGAGQVDWYGFDAYPNGFDCSDPAKWSEVPDYFTEYHGYVAPWSAMYLAEFQGGALDGWGGVGLDKCWQLTGPEFVNVFYKNNVADGATAMSFYMIYGGTNWGNLGQPGGYTSYDYGAAIRESRILSPKYEEMKLQGLFYQTSPALLSTSIRGTGAGAPYTDSSAVHTTDLGSEESPASHFYVLRQATNQATTPVSFKLSVSTATGNITIPEYGGQIILNGRESKILPTEYAFGKSTLKYTTAEVLTQTNIDGTDYVFLYVPNGQSVEAVVSGPAVATPAVTGAKGISAKLLNSSVVITGSPSGLSAVHFGSTTVLVADKVTAKSFWQPLTNPGYITPTPSSVLVGGPYLVRNATLTSGTLALVGDTNSTTPLTVIAPSAVKKVTWNGASVKLSAGPSALGLVGSLQPPPAVTLPSLKSAKWKSTDSLPEIAPSFDDSAWVVANRTSVERRQKPYSGKLVLYADEYGFHSGNFIYRGYFKGAATGVELSVQGGSAFGFSAYLNGQFVSSGQGLSGADTVNATLTFPSGAATNGSNVLTVVLDNHGLDGDWNSDDYFKNPRGIRGYSLIGGGDFDTWKLTGNLGGENFPDKVRGGLNEGGLWVERTGAHLPGYDDSKWASNTPFTGISKAGIQAYRTTFKLDVPKGVDASLALKYTFSASSSNFRSVVYVNGWQFGRFINNLGPQNVFPIPEGILNHHGSNELAITLWSLDSQGASIANLELVTLGTFASGKEVVAGGLVRSPTYKELRK